MLLSQENSNESDLKPSRIFSLPPSVKTCVKNDKKCGSVLKSSKSITQTSLPILRKMPNSDAIDANISISATFLPNVYRKRNMNFTNYSQKSTASCNNYSTNETLSGSRNTVQCDSRTWPLSGKRYPGFRPLGYRTRPTFGEQCLKTRNQWPSPPEEPGPTLPYLDLFANDSKEDICFEPVKNDAKPKPVKAVSWIRKNRFPALFDSYNIRNGLLSFSGTSNTILGKPNQAISASTDFPGVASCKLNMTVNQEMRRNRGSAEVSDDGCSECPLCIKEFERQNVSMFKSNFPKYHIHVPSTD